MKIKFNKRTGLNDRSFGVQINEYYGDWFFGIWIWRTELMWTW